ncbi:MAG: hypothetical protein LBC09_04900, partial [Helicobacteraceae bacterium]|nr:hypothetical protein [Helicobacteraceae bacterium]
MALEYDSYRAVHDGGVDFTNVNKHVLAVKCETVRAKIFRISNYYFDQQKLYSKEEVEFDQDLVGKIERFVRNADDDKFDKLLNY